MSIHLGTALSIIENQSLVSKADKKFAKKLVREAKVAVPKQADIPRKKTKMLPSMVKKSLKSKMVWWNSLTRNEQKSYLEEHPKSKLPLKKSVNPSIKEADKNNDKKAAKNSKKGSKSKIDKSDSTDETALAPITKNKKTTKLFKIDADAINSVPEHEQQAINKEIEDAIYSPEDSNEEERDDEVEAPDNSEEEEDATGNDDSTEDEDNGDTEDALVDKVDQQLHPKQKLKFMQAAKIAFGKKYSKEEKAVALKQLGQFHALITLTKIAGAASLAALAYHFGSTPGAQAATYFALHHGEHAVRESETSRLLRRWAQKRLTGEEQEDNDESFDKLLGILDRKREKHSSSKSHGKKH